MADKYLSLVNSPVGAAVASRIGLPRPAVPGKWLSQPPRAAAGAGWAGSVAALPQGRRPRGAQVFAAVIQRMFGIRNQLGIKLPRLIHQPQRHRMEKRLHRFHNGLPGTGGV